MYTYFHVYRDRSRLLAAIDKKRAKREADMIAAGSTPEEASTVTTAEAEKVYIHIYLYVFVFIVVCMYMYIRICM
jgi:hypothetical protein